MSRSEAGLAYVAAFAMLLMILTTAYTVYQAYGVPGVCKEHEARALSEFLEDVKALATAQSEVIATKNSLGVPVKKQYSYPTIPFFLTPSYIPVGTELYNITVTLENVASDDVSIPKSITLSGKGVWLRFNALFSSPVQTFVELGIVATDGAYVSGSIVSDGVIYLPFFDGATFSQWLYPVSGGGKGIVIKPADPSENIVIRISGSKIPQQVWQAYASRYSLSVSFDPDTNDVIVSLPPKKYTLISGVASFGEGRSTSPAYLLPRSALNQRSPAVVDVVAVDEYFNPVEADIRLRCADGCPVDVCTPSPSGMTCTLVGPPVTYHTEEASAVVYAESSADVSVVVASIDRPVGGPYEVAFSVVKTS